MSVQLHTTDLHLIESDAERIAEPSDGTATWERLVREGRELAIDDNDRQWRIGDLALEVAEMRPHGGVPAEVEDRMNRFSDETGIKFNTLRAYRQVSAQWPEDRRLSSVSWSVHQIFAGLDERFELVASMPWTVRSAREHIAGTPSDEPYDDVDPDDLLGHREECHICGAHRKFWAPLLRRRNKK